MRGLLLAVVLLLLLSPSLDAQREATGWVFARGATQVQVNVVRADGYASLPASALAGLGAEVAPARDGVTLRIGQTAVRMRTGSPFYTVGDQLRQLVHPVRERQGAVHIPVQFVVDHLPVLLDSGLTVDVAARTVRSQPARSRVTATAPAPAPARPAADSARRAPSAPAVAATPARAAAPTKRLVVIDAGHGGVDPGARGPGGVREKDVALAVSRRLAAILRDDPTLEVRMTRERDTLVALTDRTRMANRWRQEGQDALFMSIHTNAHDTRSARGFETYFLSEARTDDARAVAQRENAAQRFETASQALDPLSFIMLDLRQNQYLRDSSDWAAMVQRRLASVHPGPNRGVKQAGFVVLNGAFMPAVLVELGFISHPEEERMLASAEYQGRIARQLAQAISDFFARSAATAAR